VNSSQFVLLQPEGLTLIKDTNVTEPIALIDYSIVQCLKGTPS